MCVGFCGFLLESLVTSVCAGTSYFVDPAHLPLQHAYCRACKRCLSSPLSAATSKFNLQEPFARCQRTSDGPGEVSQVPEHHVPADDESHCGGPHHVLQQHPYSTGYDGVSCEDITNLRLGPPAGLPDVTSEPLVGVDY